MPRPSKPNPSNYCRKHNVQFKTHCLACSMAAEAASPSKHKLNRSLRALLRETEQAAWDALARGDFSAFGLAADTWVAVWAALQRSGPPVMPPLKVHAFEELIRTASNYRSATAPDYEGNK